MSQLPLEQLDNPKILSIHWRGIFKISAITISMGVIVMILAVSAFFIWPYLPGFKSTAEIFLFIQNDKLGGLMALDFFLLIGNLLAIGSLIGIYVILKQVNQSLALLAFILGIIAVIAILPARPILEVFYLSDSYATATTDAERSHYLAAGEALLMLFNGTAWAINYIFGAVSGMISSLLMLRSTVFGKATAYIGIITSTVAVLSIIGFIVPIIAMVLAMLAMPGYIIWNLLVAIKFFKLGWPAKQKGNV